MIINLEHLRRDFKQNRKQDEIVANRLNLLIGLTKIELEYSNTSIDNTVGVKIEAFCCSFKISRRTLSRYKSRYIKYGWPGLRKRKITGRRANGVTGQIAKKITEMRKKYRWGAEVIQVHLNKDHNIKISKYRIERYLTRSELRKKYPCTTLKKYKNNKKNKHDKVVVVNNPGDHTQIDVKFLLSFFPGQKCYVYNFIDHASNWSYKKAFLSYGPRETRLFMLEVIKNCPFKIRRLQSDGGTEFTYKYISKNFDEPKIHPLDSLCKAHDIRHVVIPAGEKELQGLVERSHRQDDQEFYFREEPVDIQTFNEHLSKFAQWRNEERRFKKLKWQTPNEWLQNYKVGSMLPAFTMLFLCNLILPEDSRLPTNITIFQS